jgi:hypothetical protein
MSWYDIQELFWLTQHGLIELLLMVFLAAGVLWALVRGVTAVIRRKK